MIKDIPGFHGYGISQEGRLYSKWRTRWGLGNAWRELTPFPNQDGYLTHFLTPTGGGKKRWIPVHKLMALSWLNLGDCPDGMTVNHKDGNKTNNKLSNLEVVTVQQNLAHAIATGLWKPKQGASHPNAKLTEQDVLTIRNRAAQGEHYKTIAKDFPICASKVLDVINRKSWRHV